MSLFIDALTKSISHRGYYVGSILSEKYPDQAVIEGPIQSFDLHEFASSGQCTIEPSKDHHAELNTYWVENGVSRTPENVCYDVMWNGERLTVFLVTFQPSTVSYFWIVARTQEIADRFFVTVSRWCSEVRSEILVFAGGHFYKDEGLYRDIQNASLNGIILKHGLREEIVDDLKHFFNSKPLYDDYRIPWKRGVLFLGPPGNGKTLTMKALVKELGFPCIYVKSFDLPNNAYPQAGINAVFARARQTTPCFLVLEDLDALVGDHNRSFFLNELDGFASNAGIVTLATSNHAERLDPSILERPSRFDRKYHFDLPQQSERVQYVTYWNGVLAPQLTLNDDEAQQIAEQTDGFSFAYIKELFLSAMMRWASSHQSERFGAIALEQIEALRAQMSTVSADAPEAAAPAPWFPFPPHIMRMMAMRGFPGGD